MREKKIIKCDCENDIPPIEEQFIDIMKNFDFKHVHMMMDWDKARVCYDDDGEHINYHKWETFHKPENSSGVEDFFNHINLKVPSVSTLKKNAEDLLKAAIRFAKANPRSKFYMTASGPFKVTYRYGILELECVFEDWSWD